MKNRCVDLIAEHIFLFIINILSLSLALLIPIYVLITEHLFFVSFNLQFFIPWLLIFIVSIVSILLSKRKPICSAVVALVLNLSIFLVQVFYILVYAMLILILHADRNYTNPTEYSNMLRSVRNQECISHFPNLIPSNASDIQMFKSQSSWFGSTEVVLKYSIDNSNIENEIKKHNYIRYIAPGNFDFVKPVIGPISLTDLSKNGFSFYIIDECDVVTNPQCKHPYQLGLGVNKNNSQIIYYYINPD